MNAQCTTDLLRRLTGFLALQCTNDLFLGVSLLHQNAPCRGVNATGRLDLLVD